MRSKIYLHLLFLSLLTITANAQNYLRVANPDFWDGPISHEPDWHLYQAHGQLEDVTIIAEPQGIYTEIGFYATISQGDAWNSWAGDYEIVWQFALPAQTIVHDSWLWVGQDIIKADMIDFWTALETYEDIVDRNQDPSFFYRLPDNRYEIRIYPLFDGESRRIKMSFLVPTNWDVENVTTSLLQNLLQSTDLLPTVVKIGMPVDDEWGVPGIKLGSTLTKMTNTIINGAGDPMHYVEIPGNQFISASRAELVVDAPFSNNNSYLSTYSDLGEQFYQLAFAPDWDSLIQSSQATNSLILVDYNEQKTNLSIGNFLSNILFQCRAHFTSSDNINVAVQTTTGIQFLSDQWWAFNDKSFTDLLTSLAILQDTSDLEALLTEGFAWANNQTDIDHIYLITANDDYVFPPYAEDVFASIEANLPTGIPFTLMDYQTENVSVIYYGGQEYRGNAYFYQLLSGAFDEMESFILLEDNMQFGEMLAQTLPAYEFPKGILDYHTTLENGISYQRYSLNGVEFSESKKGVILQTGKYLGNFPMNINANLVLENGSFFSLNHTIEPDEIVQGDTLMREMWYGPHLRERELFVSTNDEYEAVIEESITERVLTGLTAFLALEPSQGGEPCIDCLFNAGDIQILEADEEFQIEFAEILVTPNPVTDLAKISLIADADLSSSDWDAVIFDAAGRVVAKLGDPTRTADGLVWEWQVGQNVKSGIYFCKMQSELGTLIGKVVVMSK